MAEYNDIYDKDKNITGRIHRRGTPWKKGEYGLVVCVWVYDGYDPQGEGKVLCRDMGELRRRSQSRGA